jgi:hypothetical protein
MGIRIGIAGIAGAVFLAFTPGVARAATCPAFAPAYQVVGTIAEPGLTELSDFVASSDNPGVFWTEEDSFNPNKIYAVNSSGTIVGEFTIAGTTDIDWEDLALDRQAGTDALYVGDIGDNKANRDGTQRILPRLYRFPEPVVSASGPKVTGTITTFDTFVYGYANEVGVPLPPRNAESLMVDPLTHDVYIVEKLIETVNGTQEVAVFRFDQPLQNAVTNVARRIGYVTPAKKYTSADISPTGDIAVKASGGVAFIWPRTGATVDATLAATPAAPCKASPLIASEAIGWAPDGLWTVPEGRNPPIVRLPFGP